MQLETTIGNSVPHTKKMTSKIHKNVVCITCLNFKIQPPKYLSLIH
ncbi:hypothetical protein BVRB_1g019000 [Beta vulgaris subsp. vulgaris]|nr:hypothetical protein BVRB_1g019000 [Beta vulgaris subsp. vulgaris]